MSRGKKTKKKMPRRRQEASSVPTATRRTEMHRPAARGGVAGTSKPGSYLKLPLEGCKPHSQTLGTSNIANGLAHVNLCSTTPERSSRDTVNTIFDDTDLQKVKQTLRVTDLSYVPLLLSAVILEKVETVNKLLEDGHQVNSCAEDKSTPLMWAVRNKNLEMINVLIKHDADPTLLDKNADNVALIAMQSASWDENDFLDFWKTINSRIDLNHANNTGNTVLHYTIKRQWNILVEQILKTEVNVNCANLKGVTPLMMAGIRANPCMVSALLRSHVDVSQEDFKGCTALCYSVASGMQKKLDTPHPSLEKLVCAISTEESKLSMESYLKRRLELLIYPPEPENRFTSTISSIIRSVFRFFVQYTRSGLKILLSLDVFGKIREAMTQHIGCWCYLQAILEILNDLLCYCERSIDKNLSEVSERDLMDLFTIAGLSDTCLCILKRYAKDPSSKWLAISGLEPIFAKCMKNKKAREWLRENYYHLEPYYEKCIDIKHALMLDIEENDREHNYFDSVSGESDRRFDVSPLATSPEHPSAANVGSSKRQRRKIKTLKTKLAKIRSLTLLAENNDCCIQNAPETEYFPRNTRSPSSHDVTTDIRVADQISRSLPRPKSLHRMNGGSSRKLTQEIKSIKSDSERSNFDAIPKTTNAEDPVENRSKDLVIGNQVEFHTSTVLRKTLECDPQVCDTNPKTDTQNCASSHPCADDLHQSDLLSEYAPENVEATTTYLSTLFEEIISSYRRNWQRDRDLGYPGFQEDQSDPETLTEERKKIRTEEIARLNAVLPKLEDSYIRKLTHSWRSLISKICQTANQNAKEFKNMITLIQLRLLMYRVRPNDELDKKNYSKWPDQARDESVNQNLGTIDDKSIKKIESDFPQKSTKEIHCSEARKQQGMQYSFIRNVKTSVDNPAPMINENKTVNATDRKCQLQTTMYRCYEQDILNQSKNLINPGDTKAVVYTAQIVEALRTQVTMNSTTQTFGELLQTNSTGVFYASPPVFQLQTTKATAFKLTENPWIVNNRHCMLDAQRPPTIWDMPRTRACVSRWDVLITELRNYLNQRRHSTGEVVLSAPEQRKHFTISPGGTFGPIELGLDANGRPLAVRRLPRETGSSILPLLAPVLALRHNNILPFFIYAKDGAEIYLGTPLCEYNLGEYLMCLKMSKELEQRSMVLVKQLLLGLSFLHNRKVPVIHGNMKPSNLMIDRTGGLRLAEFGLWKSLYCNNHPSSSSIIWFARESYVKYKEEEIFECTCATDVQVAGMLVHFILTGGLHSYGTQTNDILENISRGHPTIQCQDCEIVDLVTWMLVSKPQDRPSVSQVLTHIVFWDTNKKWSFLLACAGITTNSTPLPLPLEAFQKDLEAEALSHGVKGDWLFVLRKQFPSVIVAEGEYSESPTSLLFFIRRLLASESVAGRSAVQQFVLRAFPTLPLSLYRLLETTRWLSHPVFYSYKRLDD